MITDDLQPKWSNLEKLPREGDYDLLRIAAECHANISLGITPNAQRCLVLALPMDFSVDFRPVERDRLSLTKVSSENYVALTLIDDEFRDLFDDLIVSMYNFIRDIEDVDQYSKVFTKTFHKWSRFFDRDDGERLPRAVIQGIFGEILYLRKLLLQHSASEVNELQKAWRGPYDQGTDFILDDKNVEVKTRTPANASVRIRNEDQLEQLEGKGLELAVVTVAVDYEEGMPLSELARKVVDIIEERLGDPAIFYTTLSQKNLGPANLTDYDDIMFIPKEIASYDCLARSFPRIVRSELPDALLECRYSLNTTLIGEFMIESETL